MGKTKKMEQGRKYMEKRQKKEILAKERTKEKEGTRKKREREEFSRDQVRVLAQKTCPA